MDFGNVRACLGNQVSAEQIAQIRPILKKVGDKNGNFAFGVDILRITLRLHLKWKIFHKKIKKIREILLIFYTKVYIIYYI